MDERLHLAQGKVTGSKQGNEINAAISHELNVILRPHGQEEPLEGLKVNLAGVQRHALRSTAQQQGNGF